MDLWGTLVQAIASYVQVNVKEKETIGGNPVEIQIGALFKRPVYNMLKD